MADLNQSPTPEARYLLTYHHCEGFSTYYFDSLEELDEVWDMFADEDDVTVAQIMRRAWVTRCKENQHGNR